MLHFTLLPTVLTELQAKIYPFKVNKINTRKRRKIYSNLIITKSKQHHGSILVPLLSTLGHILHFLLACILLTLSLYLISEKRHISSQENVSSENVLIIEGVIRDITNNKKVKQCLERPSANSL